MSSRKIIRIICIASLLSSTSQVAIASDYPKLYSGKAEVSVGSTQRFFSTEILDDSGQETSRVKVFAADDASPIYSPSPFSPTSFTYCRTPDYDCLIRSIVPYYSLGDYLHPNMKLYSGKVSVNGKDVESDSVLVYPPKQIVGDVYSPKDTFNKGDSGFTFMEGNHLYAATHPDSNAAWQVAGYQIDPKSLLSWDRLNFAANVAMKQNINRLINFAHVLSSGSTMVFQLTSSGGDIKLSASNTLDNPEGEIWYYPGDLTITTDVTFSGKGTLIVGGNLTIGASAKINSTNAQLGIIVLGDTGFTIDNTGSRKINIRAAVFSPNTVDIKAPIEFSGSIVADKINITSSTAIIKYDKQLTTSPPPGINYFISPDVGTTY